METTRDQFSAAADDAVSRAAATAHEAVDRFAAKIGPAVDKVRTAAATTVDSIHSKAKEVGAMEEQWLDGARDYVRARPLTALTVAVVAGLLISRWARSSS